MRTGTAAAFVLLCCFTVGALLLPGAVQSQVLVGRETRITTGYGDTPRISGNIVIYTLYWWPEFGLYDLATANDQRVGTEYPYLGPGGQLDVSDGVIAYTDYSIDVIVHEVATGAEQDLTASSGSASSFPSIGQYLVAWHDDRNGENDIYAANLATGEPQRRVTDDPGYDLYPSVDAGIIVWQRCSSSAQRDCDIYAYDWATRETTQITATPDRNEMRPAISGSTIVYYRPVEDETGMPIGSDVFAFDLTTKVERQISLPNFSSNPRISGDWVVFQHLGPDGWVTVHLVHLPTGNVYDLRDVLGGQVGDLHVPDVDGNRVVYTRHPSDDPWNLNVYMFEFELVGTLAVEPATYSYGDVQVGETEPTTITVTNTAAAGNVSITGLTFDAAGSPAFTVTSPTSFPLVLAPTQTLDVTVTFAPTETALVGAVLYIASNDPLRPSIPVELSGNGVVTDTPSEILGNLLVWLDGEIASGRIAGNGPGRSAPGRLGAFRNMLEATGDLINAVRMGEACLQLRDAYDRADGIEPPPDFAVGESVGELRTRLTTLHSQLGCE